ncbi:MAG: hypothetical protein J4G19_07780 [Pseudomonadales bacterium]|nr:hypothetical protein [Pseudomonadales bacterium]
MSNSLTVRDIDPSDKSWLRRESRSVGISMEELVRRLIHEKRTKTECPPLPSEVFARYFGEEHGVDLPIESNFRFRPVSFTEED